MFWLNLWLNLKQLRVTCHIKSEIMKSVKLQWLPSAARATISDNSLRPFTVAMHNDAGNGLSYVAIWLLQWTSLLTIGFHTRSRIDSLVWILTEHISGAKNISEKGKFASPDHNERKNVCEEWSSLLPRNCHQRHAVSGDGQWAEAARQSWQLLRKKQLQLTDYDVVELRNWRRHLEPQWKVWWGCEDGA